MSTHTDTSTPPTPRVLVVDDNSDIAEALSALLELQGFEVQVAHSGEAGVELAREFKPRLIFLDLGLPGMSGYQAARQIRENTLDWPLTLVALTGYGESVVQKKVAAAGFDTFLLKPAKMAQIQAILDTL